MADYLLAWYRNNLEQFDIKRTRRRIELIEKVKCLIAENYGNPNLSLDDLATAIGLSASYLRSLFRETTGETLSDYLAEYRMQQATNLLTKTHTPIADVARQVGIASVNYFHSLFKRRFGVTSMEYRRNSLTGE